MSTGSQAMPHEVERRLGPGFLEPRPISIVRGEGSRLFDEDDRSYLDLSSSYGVTCLGHAHPELVETLQEQSRRLWALTPSYGNDERAAYLAELAAVLPMEGARIFLCNSGTESIEAALKLARSSTGRQTVVSTMRGFHGRTAGSLAVTWEKHYREPFEPLVPGTRFVPHGKLEALEQAIDGETAALVLEVVQGEGGVRPASDEYLRAARELCTRNGALLILDEVQTGFGRTGKLFACEEAGVEPDLLCMAKGMAGGFPIGGVALGPRIGAVARGSHGSTFGGNPLACAVARATLRVLLRDGLARRTQVLGEWLRAELRAIAGPEVREVRGRGLMIGVELRERSPDLLRSLLDLGIIALGAGPRVLRLLPPLTIDRAELQEALLALTKIWSRRP